MGINGPVYTETKENNIIAKEVHAIVIDFSL
jgi:hypothetical protein